MLPKKICGAPDEKKERTSGIHFFHIRKLPQKAILGQLSFSHKKTGHDLFLFYRSCPFVLQGCRTGRLKIFVEPAAALGFKGK
ncbi:MAG: hypothetical protein CW346_12920, partial [Bacillaceae bacterium]|nr:hypothetical protein [Bacillaceae bacterium]